MWSFQRLLVWWWGLFLIIQQAERLFLLPETVALEMPSARVLGVTLMTGLRADLIVATLGVILAMTLACGSWMIWTAVSKWRGIAVGSGSYGRSFQVSSALIGLLLLGFTTVDMGYYGYGRNHLDWTFFEYVEDLLGSGPDTAERLHSESTKGQAYQQTQAELMEGKRWGARLAGFLLVQGLALAAWYYFIRRFVEPRFIRLQSRAPRRTTAGLALGLLAGVAGCHPEGPWSIARVGISSSTYYSLSQNPVWCAADVLADALVSQLKGIPERLVSTMALEDAIQVSRKIAAPGATFPFPRYPFVKAAVENEGLRLEGTPNILLLFVEGLDRRYLGLTIPLHGTSTADALPVAARSPTSASGALVPRSDRGIRVTPFLDRLKDESVSFMNFFSNGAKTHHGLFTSFCSYYPRYGRSAMKARYTYEYLCLPALLRSAGYWTEMVVGQNRDHGQSHMALFLSRNGLHQFLDERDFPAGAQRLGIGITDGALFDFLRARIEDLNVSGRAFLLAALTLSTHHPYQVPNVHPEIEALQAESDRYLSALRYFDIEFERFFTGLRRDGLLKNTIVVLVGDHGRHEKVGGTEIEHRAGHHTAALLVWLDESLRQPSLYHPRPVWTIASHVDLAPTLLALTGQSPRFSPFLGRDLSCVLGRDCLNDNFAYLIYGGEIGLATQDGLLLHRVGSKYVQVTDLSMALPAENRPITDPDLAARYKQLLGLFVSSNVILDQNRVWSRKLLGK